LSKDVVQNNVFGASMERKTDRILYGGSVWTESCKVDLI